MHPFHVRGNHRSPQEQRQGEDQQEVLLKHPAAHSLFQQRFVPEVALIEGA